MESAIVHRLAHDLKDSTKVRSKDVALEEETTFQDLLLAPDTYAGLRQCGFERPSPIQLATIPLGRCGFDLIIQSKAGTGKTCIFTIIALEALQGSPCNSTQTLIVAPTREIALQTHEVVTGVGSAFGNFQCVLCIGGTEVKQDRVSLRNLDSKGGGCGCQVVVGTPGRIKQLIELNILKTQQIELFVLDEADKLMDEQFKNQVDEIYRRLPEDKQMIVTSATYPNELAQFLQRYMKAPKSIRLGQDLSLEALEEYYLECRAGHSGKKTLDNKLYSLMSLLRQWKFSKCIIFTNFQSRAPLICDYLNADTNFLDVIGTTNYICAELPQPERVSTFNKFKRSKQKLLVSTDISARGIDIQDIDLVVNLDLPADVSTYYHRIGRAGRFGQPGKAVSIVSSDSLDRSIFTKHIQSDRINKLSLDE